MAAKLSNLYITLDVMREEDTGMRGVAAIRKCKDYQTTNPSGKSCYYHTGGKHGKLFIDSAWERRNE